LYNYLILTKIKGCEGNHCSFTRIALWFVDYNSNLQCFAFFFSFVFFQICFYLILSFNIRMIENLIL